MHGTVGHTGIARLCYSQWSNENRLFAIMRKEAPASFRLSDEEVFRRIEESFQATQK